MPPPTARESTGLPQLVLASASPRRKALLAQAGFVFDIEASSVDETLSSDEAPVAFATRLSIAKALSVAANADASAVVLGADTIVVCNGVIYGKPRDRADAVGILEALVGRNHDVVTAWALACGGAPDAEKSGFVRSVVRMRDASRAEIDAYVDSGEPIDKAGAYAAQGDGRHLVAAILGALDNVIGLPVAPVARALSAFGILPRAIA